MEAEMLEARYPVALLVTNANGDHLLNLPAVRALSNLFPNRLALVCTRGTREQFFSELNLRPAPEIELRNVRDAAEAAETSYTKVYDFTERVMFTRVLDIGSIAEGIGECDLLLSLDPSPLPAVEQLLQRLSPAHSIGFHPACRVALPLDYERHSADLAFELPRQLNPSLRLEEFAAPPLFPPDSRRHARALRDALPAGFNVLAVHADTKPEKMWSTERFVRLLDMFLESHPDYLVVVVGTQRLGLDGGRFGERVLPCYGLPITVSMGLVGEADLFVGVDSCMLHVADLFRVPGVGLFGPTRPRQWGFRFGLHRHVVTEGDMSEIREDEVLGALEAVLAEAVGAS